MQQHDSHGELLPELPAGVQALLDAEHFTHVDRVKPVVFFSRSYGDFVTVIGVRDPGSDIPESAFMVATRLDGQLLRAETYNSEEAALDRLRAMDEAVVATRNMVQGLGGIFKGGESDQPE